MKPKKSFWWAVAAIATVAILGVANTNSFEQMTTLELEQEFHPLSRSGPVQRPIPRASFALDFSAPEMAEKLIEDGSKADTVVEALIGIDPGSANDIVAAAEKVAPLQVDAISAVAVTPKDVKGWIGLVSDDQP